MLCAQNVLYYVIVEKTRGGGCSLERNGSPEVPDCAEPCSGPGPSWPWSEPSAQGLLHPPLSGSQDACPHARCLPVGGGRREVSAETNCHPNPLRTGLLGKPLGKRQPVWHFYSSACLMLSERLFGFCLPSLIFYIHFWPTEIPSRALRADRSNVSVALDMIVI